MAEACDNDAYGGVTIGGFPENADFNRDGDVDKDNTVELISHIPDMHTGYPIVNLLTDCYIDIYDAIFLGTLGRASPTVRSRLNRSSIQHVVSVPIRKGDACEDA